MFLAIRLILHAVAPKTYGPAGGYDIYTAMVSGVLYTFGFIVAATLGCTAGSRDLTEGMFRHLVVTGRSRLALYLARIPAGLAIIVPLVAVGFTIVCAVCVFAAPTYAQLQRRDRARPACRVPRSRTGPPTMPTRSSATSTSERTALPIARAVACTAAPGRRRPELPDATSIAGRQPELPRPAH